MLHHKLHFIGWTRNLADAVAALMLPDSLPRPFSLRDTILVVPTAQSGRRLRHALARRAAGYGTGVLTGPVITPFTLFDLVDSPSPRVLTLEEAAMWLDVLTPERCRQLPGLFPLPPQDIDFAWRRKSAALLIKLRQQLAEAGLTPSDVLASEHVHAAEKKRWRDIVTLEAIVRDRFNEQACRDPVDHQLERAAMAMPPVGIRRVVVVACPELAPMLRQLLDRWSQMLSIDVFVHAAADQSDAFDSWGIPAPTEWCSKIHPLLELPHTTIMVVDTPREQADAVGAALRQERTWAEAGRFAIGVPDESVTPYVVHALEQMGCPCFDPSGVTHRQHPIYHYIKAWRDVVCRRDYDSLRAYIRMANVLRALERTHAMDGAALLVELDNVQNECLPDTVDDVAVYVAKNKKMFPLLARLLTSLATDIDADHSLQISTIMDRLKMLYEDKVLKPGRPDDDAFISVARGLVDAGEDILKMMNRHGGLSLSDWVDLLLEQSEARSFYPEDRQGAMELEGWLELPWNDAPLMIVTGVNEGFVPDSGFDDLFLPDSVREKLGLRCDASRAARDSYHLFALAQTRSAEGRLVLISGRQSDQGDVLKPSRLFWNCSDEDMVQRARLFFTAAETVRRVPVRQLSSWHVTEPPDERAAARLHRPVWNVTDFSSYLACPFRFYLQRILEMNPQDDAKEEMDDLDFGKLVHHALEVFGRDPSLWRHRDAGQTGDVLAALIQDRLRVIYGLKPPLVVALQAQSATQRLRAFAEVHVRDRSEGWEIIAVEEKFTATIAGKEVRGKIDRLDRHPDGRYRVLDYKTSDKTNKTPDALHLIAPRVMDLRPYVAVTCRMSGKKKESLRHWADLQLPFYVHFLQQKYGPDTRVQAGYVRLAKAVSDITLSLWDGLDETLIQSAVTCAEGILQDAAQGRFGPPLITSAKDTFDERWWPDFLENVQPPHSELVR